jgi:hypothetical protein
MRNHQWLTITVLMSFLAATAWYGSSVWAATDPMPTYAYVAMVLGTVVAVGLGCGLTALMYYSQRRGYDDVLHKDRHRDS